MSDLCADEEITSLLAILQGDDEAGLDQIAGLLLRYPADPRLSFLAGSVLAGLQRYDEARVAMQRAIEISPTYELARFQLGFLELTSGLSAAAQQTWAPFASLPDSSPFRLFSDGLQCLLRDDYAECDRLLRRGMAVNQEHPLINGDMQLILAEIADKINVKEVADQPLADTASAAHQLLQQFQLKDDTSKTKH